MESIAIETPFLASLTLSGRLKYFNNFVA